MTATAAHPLPADRLPPQSKEAEAGVLGAALRDPDCLDDLAPVVAPADFYSDAHAKILRAMLALRDDGKPVDAVAVFERLRAAGHADDAGGPAYLAHLYDAAPTAAHAEYHARIVREKAALRGLIHAHTELLRDAYDGVTPAADLIAAAEQTLFDLGTRATGLAGGPAELAAVTRGVLARMDERAAGPAPDPFVRSGFAALDHLIGGFRPGRLYVVAARPSVGKSAIALSFLLNAAGRGVPGLLYSLEMGADEIAERALAVRSGVPLNRITGGGPATAAEAKRLVGAAGPGPVWVDDRPDVTAAAVASGTRRAVRRHGVGLVAVDYLQLLAPENPRDARHQQVGQDARRLKQLARRCGVPVVCLAQLNREVEARGDPKPKLSDLRDSGEIEQHADAVLLLYRDGHPPPGAAEQAVGCVLAKQRGGPTGEFALNYVRPCVRFEDRVPVG